MKEERTFKAAVFTTDGELKMVNLPHKDWFSKTKEMLNINTADLPRRTINGMVFDFLCDDEGLFNNPQPTLISDKGEVLLVGDIAIFHPCDVDMEGNEIMYDLTEEEFNHIKKCLTILYSAQFGVIGAIAGGDYE